jgi:hypothetical protein
MKLTKDNDRCGIAVVMVAGITEGMALSLSRHGHTDPFHPPTEHQDLQVQVSKESSTFITQSF